MTTPTRICALEDIQDGQAIGLTFGSGVQQINILVARRGNEVFAYRNACPHVGSPLDWQPDKFMSPDGSMLQCATHGAQFRIKDGVCVHGPCKGKRLKPLAVRLRHGEVTAILPLS